MNVQHTDDDLKRLMSDYMKGDKTSSELLLKSIDEGELNYFININKTLGNEAYKNKLFDNAIDFYSQALAGEKNEKQIAVLLSNRCAAYLEMKRLEEALEDARKCIQFDAKWSKGWFRAGRVLFEMKRYDDAEKVFTFCKTIDKTSNSNIQKWIDDSNQLHLKQKSIERITIDYKRFEGIYLNEEEESTNDEADDKYIEFMDDTPTQQQQQLTELLTGQKTSTSPPAVNRSSTIKFDVRSLFDELPEIYAIEEQPSKNEDATELSKLQITNKISLALCNYLELKSECAAIRQMRELLHTDFITTYATAVTHLFECLKVHQGVEFFTTSFAALFMGVGTGVSIVKAAKIIEETVGLRGDDEKNNKNIATLFGCTHLASQTTLLPLRATISANDVSSHISIIPKRVEAMKCASTACREDDLLENTICDLHQRAAVLVVDTQMLEYGVLGRRLLPSVRYARQQLCIEQPMVLPNRITVYAQCLSIHLPQHDTYNLTALEDHIWSFYFDVIDLNDEWSWKSISNSKEVFCFELDGPLNRLDECIPLREHKQLEFECTQDGDINAVVMWYTLHSPADEFGGSSSAAPFMNTIPVVSTQSSDMHASIPPFYEEHNVQTKCKAVVQWVDSIKIEKGGIIKVEAMHTPTRINFKVIPPTPSPSKLHYTMLPKWQIDAAKDVQSLNAWSSCFSSLVQQHYTEFTDASTAIKVMNVGCGVGLHTMAFANSVARLYAKAIHSPHAAIHIQGIDMMQCNVFASKQLIRMNHSILMEHEMDTSKPTAVSEWRPIKELNQHTSNNNTTHATSNNNTTHATSNNNTTHATSNNNTTHAASNNNTTHITSNNTTHATSNNTTHTTSNNTTHTTSNNTTHAASRDELKNRKTCRSTSAVSSRISFSRRDLREYFPPPSYMTDGSTLLAIGEAYGIPLGTDIQSSLPPLTTDNQLPTKINALIWNAFDVGLLGEGVLFLTSYARRVLMHTHKCVANKRPCTPFKIKEEEETHVTQQHKRSCRGFKLNEMCLSEHSIIIPFKAKVFGMCIQLGRREVEGVDVSAWQLEEEGEDYTSVLLEECCYVQLSNPIEFFEFHLGEGRPPETNASGGEFDVPIINSGIVNAIVYWYTLYLDDIHTVSTAPSMIESRVGDCGYQPTSMVTTRKQALQRVVQMHVDVEDTISVKATHDISSIKFQVKGKQGGSYNRSNGKAMNPVSSILQQKCASIAENIANTLESSPSQRKLAAECAISIAMDSGRQSKHAIDPYEAAWFAQSFFM